MADGRWMALDGVVNMRDLGGLPTHDGRTTRRHRLIRSDNLQDLSVSDVRHLLEEIGITDVVDLRSHKEVALTGPGPLRETELAHHHHSFLRDDDREVTVEEALAMPWLEKATGEQRSRESYWREHYLGYLGDRPGSVCGALEVVAASAGGTLVHCAAGKDRTGTVVGLALSAVGVPDEVIVADYAASAERIEAIIDRLRHVAPYSESLVERSIDEQTPKPAVMAAILETLANDHGGAAGWLREHGWDDAQLERLRTSLVN